MSVILGNELLASGRPLTAALADHHNFALAEITAGLVRSLQQVIMRAPRPEEPAHAKVVGTKTRPVRKAMARAAAWVIDPPDG